MRFLVVGGDDIPGGFAEASSEARNSTPEATSMGSPIRRKRGCRIEERAEASSPLARERIKLGCTSAGTAAGCDGPRNHKGEAYGVPAFWTH